MAGFKAGKVNFDWVDGFSSAAYRLETLNKDPTQAVHEDLGRLFLILVTVELIAKDHKPVLSEIIRLSLQEAFSL